MPANMPPPRHSGRDGADDLARFHFGAMFSCVGVLYDRVHSRMIGDYGGVAQRDALVRVVHGVLRDGQQRPAGHVSGFVGEFMVILASFQAKPWIAATAALTLIIGAAYTLWMVKRVMFGEARHAHVKNLSDINGREALVLGGFAAATLLFGIWPAPLTGLMDVSIGTVVDQLMRVKV
jgi:NADH-quinone oxidoreductase subunit M